MDLFIVIICSISIALLGLLILARNPAQANNRRFAFVSVSLILWTIFNYFSDNAQSNNLLFTRLTFLAGIAAIYSVLLFISNFPSRSNPGKNILLRLHAMSILTLMLVPIIFTPLFISSVSADPSVATINTGPAYPLFIFYVAISLFLLMIITRRQALNASSSIQRQQVAIVFSGIAIYAILAIIFNIILPALSDNWSSSRFGPLFTLIFVALVAYAVVRRRLFDIKFLIVRSLGYVVSILVIGSISFVLLRWVTSLLDQAHISDTIQTNLIVLVILVIAISYQPSKKFFDRVTNNLFYRDAYNTRDLLDEFNQVLVSTIILDDLLKNSAATIEKYIKPSTVSFVIRNENDGHIIFPKGKNYSADFLQIAAKSSHNYKSMLMVTDLLDDETEATTKRHMQKEDVGMLVRINSGVSNRGIGYIFLGYKKSGNIYSSQDTSAMKIIANGLAVAIQNALRFEEIQSFNIKLREEVTRQTHNLRNANERLRLLDQTKDDFISMASHQLRTPLTSVKGYLSMVLEGDAGKLNDKQDKLLSQAFFSSQRMVYLIADLLNVSRLRTGKFIIEPSPVNLAEVIEGEVEQLIETAASRNLKITYEKPKTFPTLLFDETKIRQVIMNFIDNAVHYTPSGGHIQVRLSESEHSIEYTVTDDGIGIPKSEQHHLFTKFYRAGNARKARPDGTGLGLFMAKKVIIAQGGSILFRSQEGKGSTFGFTFAKAKLQPPVIHEPHHQEHK